MLAAIGFAVSDAYSASLACFAAPGAKLSAGELGQCAEIARRHIALVKPKRLIMPFYSHNQRPSWLIRLGMITYDVLSFDKKTGRFVEAFAER
mgnify:CR=1 FL=1